MEGPGDFIITLFILRLYIHMQLGEIMQRDPTYLLLIFMQNSSIISQPVC